MSKTIKIKPDNLVLYIKEDGYWLEFQASNGRLRALINLNQLGKGEITVETIRNWCHEQKEKTI
ncbi:hypothetical protein LCGC14_0392090 [marine sediment metagenome]|uniref:Uncharacterized protein n=1 Tax=marine sediment metagenome TaxID=412755 RepID=A0A0F9SZD0_9ZZZZ